jgi:hypothetical protein
LLLELLSGCCSCCSPAPNTTATSCSSASTSTSASSSLRAPFTTAPSQPHSTASIAALNAVLNSGCALTGWNAKPPWSIHRLHPIAPTGQLL